MSAHGTSPLWYRVSTLRPRLVPHAHVQRVTLRGKIWQYTAGTGITSSTPQIQTWTAFCASGAFRMYGKSCVRNRVASGYRCDPFNYIGQWQVQDQGNFAVVNWQTQAGRGSYRIDARGNQLFINGRQLKIYAPANC